MAVAGFLFGLLPYTLLGVAWLTGSAFAWVRWAVLFFPATVLAILFGQMALHRAQKAKAEPMAEALARVGRGLGFFAPVLAVALALIIPALAKENPHRERAFCQNNLKHIHSCILMYREEHDQQYPARLSEFYPEYISDLSCLVCPSSGTEPGDPRQIDAWTSYSYHAAPPDAEDDWVLREKQADWHAPGGRNVLHADGKVEYVREQPPRVGRERAVSPGRGATP